jgi:hypothetical protein
MNNTDTDNTGYTIHTGKVRENRIGQSSMDNPDTDTTRYKIHRTKIRENRRGNQQ